MDNEWDWLCTVTAPPVERKQYSNNDYNDKTVV